MSDNSTTSGDDSGKLLYCSFCGKSQHEVRKLIAGPSVFICDECVDLCNDIIREEVQENGGDAKQDRLPVPIEIKEIVTLGHNLHEHQRLVQDHNVDLLVLNTKDHDQLAMHGLAYPLAVELRTTPLLML